MEVKIEGESFRFLFDTGAPMVVSPELADKFNMKKVSSKYVTDSNNSRKKQKYVQIDSLKIGRQEFKDLVAIEIDLKYAPVIACLNIDGIIGANLMRLATWKIDYVDQVMHFSNNMQAYQPKKNPIVLPFKTKATFTPVVDLMIDSNIIKNVTFDTGSGSAISTSQNFVSHLDKKAPNVFSSYGYHTSGIYGSIPDSMFFTQRPVTLGKTQVENMTLSIHEKPSKSLLGTAFMEDYEVILNWEQGRAFLSPINPEMNLKTLGISVMPKENQLLISSVHIGSEAQKLGIAFGDVVEEINGRDCSTVSQNDYCEIREIFEEKEKALTITIKEKGSFTLNWRELFPSE